MFTLLVVISSFWLQKIMYSGLILVGWGQMVCSSHTGDETSPLDWHAQSLINILWSYYFYCHINISVWHGYWHQEWNSSHERWRNKSLFLKVTDTWGWFLHEYSMITLTPHCFVDQMNKHIPSNLGNIFVKPIVVKRANVDSSEA